MEVEGSRDISRCGEREVSHRLRSWYYDIKNQSAGIY